MGKGKEAVTTGHQKVSLVCCAHSGGLDADGLAFGGSGRGSEFRERLCGGKANGISIFYAAGSRLSSAPESTPWIAESTPSPFFRRKLSPLLYISTTRFSL